MTADDAGQDDPDADEIARRTKPCRDFHEAGVALWEAIIDALHLEQFVRWLSRRLTR